jgi:hypothetical protein
MKNKFPGICLAAVSAGMLLTGCVKDETNYFTDGQNTGLAIFSNTGNNVMSCYVNGQPWRTINRTTAGLFSPPESEVRIYRSFYDTSHSTLVIEWDGFFNNHPYISGQICLYLKETPGFGYGVLDSLDGKRLTTDSVHSYFVAYMGVVGNNNTDYGSGSIYFNRADFDSIGNDMYSGKLSGLFDASFPDFQITSGRFDHDLTSGQINF